MDDKWLPSETAPRDGTWILVCDPGSSVGHVAWSDEHNGWFNEYGMYEDPWEGNKHTFSLWMPLPSSPEPAV